MVSCVFPFFFFHNKVGGFFFFYIIGDIGQTFSTTVVFGIYYQFLFFIFFALYNKLGVDRSVVG